MGDERVASLLHIDGAIASHRLNFPSAGEVDGSSEAGHEKNGDDPMCHAALPAVEIGRLTTVWRISDFDVQSAQLVQEVARDLYLVGPYLYVVIDDGIDDLEVFDISDLTQPMMLGTTELSAGGNAVSTVGTHAYVGTDVTSADGEIAIFDLAEP